MKSIVCKDTYEIALKATEWCEINILRTQAKSMYIPAGSTPIPMYDHWESTKPNFLNDIEFLQVDEIVTGDRTNHFRQFFRQRLPSYANKIVPIEAERPVAPLGILGLGINGHVAFHEPGVDPNFRKGLVELRPETSLELGLVPPVQGMTYGVGTFWQCDSLLILVSGKKKREVLRRLFNEDLDLPASLLLRHPRLTVISDEEAQSFPDSSAP